VRGLFLSLCKLKKAEIKALVTNKRMTSRIEGGKHSVLSKDKQNDNFRTFPSPQAERRIFGMAVGIELVFRYRPMVGCPFLGVSEAFDDQYSSNPHIRSWAYRRGPKTADWVPVYKFQPMRNRNIRFQDPAFCLPGPHHLLRAKAVYIAERAGKHSLCTNHLKETTLF
jgi:hypothetical protein